MAIALTYSGLTLTQSAPLELVEYVQSNFFTTSPSPLYIRTDMGFHKVDSLGLQNPFQHRPDIFPTFPPLLLGKL